MTVSSGHGSWITAADELSPSLIEMLSLCAKFLCVFTYLFFFFQIKNRIFFEWEERGKREIVLLAPDTTFTTMSASTLSLVRERVEGCETKSKVDGSAHCF
ncbi:Uncharacterized protein APZ42_018685 [Daphnia magna]|uniref:Uncharacterized protein n=1 Tax=Daphnia magna TaxID=35525 RepID=A0A0N8DT79_9CRUS|nr:Uncharacterized protein APZ42_018685 [Daphnia magna]